MLPIATGVFACPVGWVPGKPALNDIRSTKARLFSRFWKRGDRNGNHQK
ncbi:hypothetical protein HHJ70_04805 [Mobiluncus curtisii]|nr:hypothetical protein [Mobiluncus curtisii]